MLHHIFQQNTFESCIKAVEDAYYPREKYLKYAEEQAKKTNESLNSQKVLTEYFKTESPLRLYKKLDASKELIELRLPFTKEFHEFFMKRKFTIPEQLIQDTKTYNINQVSLFKPDPKGKNSPSNVNFSANEGNYNHFVNVVAALARLIIYFQKYENVKDIFRKLQGSFVEEDTQGTLYIIDEDKEDNQRINLSVISETINYDDTPNERTLKLMFGAFYHDLGKTVTDPRHGMEGSILMSFHTSETLCQFDQIFKSHDPLYSFDVIDLSYISTLLNFHDSYGTLSTGEDGWVQLIEIVDTIKKYSLRKEKNKENQKKESQKYLFDLWLLNVADIIVSIKDKWMDQVGVRDNYKNKTDPPFWNEQESANKKITEFFESPKGRLLIHDLIISLEILDIHNKKSHKDDLSDLQTRAIAYSNDHVVERIKRLLCETTQRQLENCADTDPSVKNLAKKITEISDEQWTWSIEKAIRSISNFQEFSRKLPWIGKMDYSLNFFKKIVSYAFKKVAEEIIGSGTPTGWITSKKESSFDPYFNEKDKKDDYLLSLRASYFADNYAAIVVQILNHLLVRQPFQEYIRSIEFRDAQERLTDDKLNRIINVEGSARFINAIELVLKTVTIY